MNLGNNIKIMIFSDRDIKKAIAEKRIAITPYNEEKVQPASYDLQLDKHFLIFSRASHYVIDAKKPVDHLMVSHEIDDETPFVLHPGEFALGLVLERIGVSNEVVGRLEGKSSLGRLGVIVHATAGFLDPGNELKMTLELHNIGPLPVLLYYKMPIAQMSFEALSSPCERPYGTSKLGSKYFGADKPQASQMYKNFL